MKPLAASLFVAAFVLHFAFYEMDRPFTFRQGVHPSLGISLGVAVPCVLIGLGFYLIEKVRHK